MPSVVVTKTVIARGVNITYDVTQNSNSSGVNAASRPAPSTYRTDITNYRMELGF